MDAVASRPLESTWFDVDGGIAGERELDKSELAFVRALRSGRNGWGRVDQLGPPDQITKVR